MKDVTISKIVDGWDKSPTPATLNEALEAIRSPRWSKQVEAIRKRYEEAGGGMDGKEAVADLKLHLPGYLFSGIFDHRASKDVKEKTGLICADLDLLGDALGSIKEQVCADRHILAAFVSPTGTGLKVILKVDPAKDHEESFKAVQHFFLERFGLEIDRACRDVARICFASHDPEIFIADDAEQIPYPAPIAVYEPTPAQYTNGTGDGPGDDYDKRGDWQNVLLRHGWSKVGEKGWRRPEKTSGLSATWDRVEGHPNRFYCFSSSTEFEPGKLYKPWHIFAKLECGGDFKAAAKKLVAMNYGKPPQKPKPVMPLDSIIGKDGTQKTETPQPLVQARPLISFTYPSEDDPNILIGKDDYLGKGGGFLFVSHAGAGKSSWIMDACMMWGLGQPWMGLRCSRPLRSLIIQAEDSDRYIGKIAASFVHKNKLDDKQTKQLAENCMIVRLKGVSGPSFFAELKRLTDLHSPDLVIVNPIYLYAEGDIGRSEFAQPFLLGLDAINKEEKFAYILIHHTGKPQAKNNKGQRAEIEDWESAYMGFGSSYLANWPRCTALLEPIAGEPGKFLIKLGKGGFNAGLTKEVPQGAGVRLEPCTRIAIRHSTDKMGIEGRERPVYYWEQCEMPETTGTVEKGGRGAKYNIKDMLQFFPAAGGKMTTRKIAEKYANDLTGISEASFRRLVNEAVDAGLLVRVADQTGLGFLYHRPSFAEPKFVE